MCSKEELEPELEVDESTLGPRDHRRLGKALDLFTFSDLVGPGLPLYTPRGTAIIEALGDYLRELARQHSMQSVSIPHLAKMELYEKSGHAGKFSEELFHVESHYRQEFILKPVNCPHHTQIYASQPRSYRDLPIRYVEQTMQYRDEKPGSIGGLRRVRGFTVDDGHTFCRPEQIEAEASVIIEIIKSFYESLGLWGKHWVSLSVRDSENLDNYLGDSEDWDIAERMLEEAANNHNLNAKRIEGEAAIYGPKLDFMFEDDLGRETQLATIQLDFAMPKRFGLEYTDEKDRPQTPVMIHRAILGSFERFIMMLLESTNGFLPNWLSPEQLRIIQVNDTEEVKKYAEDLLESANRSGVRAYLDASAEGVGKKIRNAEKMRIPYMVVIGDREVESNKITPRLRKDMEPLEIEEMGPALLIQMISAHSQSRQLK